MRLASTAILAHFNGDTAAFKQFQGALASYCGRRWQRSERHMRVLYRQPNDRTLESILQAFKKLSLDEMVDCAFQYSWSTAFKFYGYFLMMQSKRLLLG